MPMTVAVTRNVSNRTRGFLASCMLEVAPGVYCSPRMSQGVRDRVKNVLASWFPAERDASIVLLWANGSIPAGQETYILGSPPYELLNYDGFIVSRHPVGQGKEEYP